MVNEITPFPGARQIAALPTSGPHRARPATPPPQGGENRARRLRSEPPSEGFGAILEAGLGQVRLPSAIELVAALEAARDHAGMADQAVPGLGRLVAAVIEDETRKLSRYLDLQGL
ncbi:hypothetical protein [Paracoccus aminophilus]|uniref:Uncharacterized protein n=1 Tax=Paracoccus aminophilus JCM 7686 TaxID=1367847 RepID=S5XNG6_PARAH|nr:hypothetical protein [Paracoccus aminophilus]AGT08869.1 hypothetical protein JCM7686_1768 [Paracoccus aminophilus JCM 7686]